MWISMSSRTPKPKYRDIIEKFTQEIVSGQVKPGQKLPSEAALVKKFNTSRITVGRALRELQLKGLVERVAGSGTYVRNDRSRPDTPRLFGLLIPDLGETEIFDPICHGIASAPEMTDHALLWGHTDMRTDSKEEQCLRLCQQFIDRKVDGVFFAPLEFEAGADQTNRKALGALRAAKIPVVLLDRRPSVVAERSRVDLVGLNNRQAGYMATEHLIQMGCKRIGFLAYQGAEATIKARLAGYRDALLDHGMSDGASSLLTQLPEEGAGFEAGSGTEMDGFVCVNDRVAGLFMHA